jgi:hypothetical protein
VDVPITASRVVRYYDLVQAKVGTILPSVCHQGDGQGGRQWLALLCRAGPCGELIFLVW